MPEKGRLVLRGGNIHYEISDRVRAVDCGGLGVIQLLVKQLELAETIDQRVKVLERHLPYRESDHVLNLIYNVMTGGSCLQDVEARRRDPVYLDALGARKVPAPSTEGDFLRRFDRNSIWDLMEAVNEARRKVWSNQDKEFHRQATIDVDGTIAPTDGQCKSGIGMSYTGHWSYHPLVVSVAETNEVLYLVNRAGNRPSHEGAAEVLDRAIELVRGGGFQKVLLRGDTDFTQTRHLDRWDQEGVEFLFGADSSQGLVGRAEGLEPSAWSRLDRAKKKKLRRRRRKNIRQALVKKNGYRNLQLEREDVAELAYRPAACKQNYRLVVVRKQITLTPGQGRLFDETRYLFYLTNLRKESAREVVFSANRRCHQENVVEQLKNGVQAMRMPSDSLESNWAYLVICCPGLELESLAGPGAIRQDDGAADSEDGVSPVPAPAGSDSLPDPAAGATSSLPAAERQRLDRNAAERSAVAQAGPLRLTRHRTKQRKSTEVQGLRSKSVRKRPKIPILASRSHSEGPPAGDHRRMRPTRAAFSPKVDHRGLNAPQKESIERPRS